MIAKLDLACAFAEHNLSSRKVAELIGLTPQTVSSYVNGNSNVNTLYVLADALGCDVRDFFFSVLEADVNLAPESISDALAGGVCVNSGESPVVADSDASDNHLPQATADGPILACPYCHNRFILVDHP